MNFMDNRQRNCVLIHFPTASCCGPSAICSKFEAQSSFELLSKACVTLFGRFNQYFWWFSFEFNLNGVFWCTHSIAIQSPALIENNLRSFFENDNFPCASVGIERRNESKRRITFDETLENSVCFDCHSNQQISSEYHHFGRCDMGFNDF